MAEPFGAKPFFVSGILCGLIYATLIALLEAKMSTIRSGPALRLGQADEEKEGSFKR
jgi:hypothetical protein